MNIISTALNNWFNEQSRWKTKAELARYIGINERTLGDYFTGRHQKPSPENQAKLYKVTGLEIFKSNASVQEQITPKRNEKIEQTVPIGEIGEQLAIIGKAISELGRLLAPTDAMARIRGVENALYTLNDELRFFRDGPPQVRGILRQRLEGPDVGYVVTLLKALFDEESFQNWLAMTTHKIGR